MVTVPVTSADLDALVGPLTGLLTAGKVRTRLSKQLYDAARLSAQEIARADKRVDLAAAQVRFAERLRTVAAEFAAAAASYNDALAGLDVPLRELLRRAAEVGFEPADRAEIRETLVVLARVADLGRDQLEPLEELGSQALRYSYAPLRERLTSVVAAVRLMEDQQPLLDEWQRQIRLVMPSA